MDKVVLITGGTNGIGYAVATKYLDCGYKVSLASLDSEQVVQSAMDTLQEKGEAIFTRCNVTLEEDCQRVIDATLARFGKIDILVNVAGVTGRRAHLIDTELSDIANTININLMGTIIMSQLAAREMVKQQSGIIVNVGSICGFLANSENVGYHASKGGVKMFTQALARELSPRGIRVLSVAPGWVKTAMVNEETVELGSSFHMRGNQIISPKEVADVIYLLTLDEASAINGSTIMADDGYSSFKGVWD